MSGFSLVEIMIAAAIFSLGLGGLSALLLTAITGTIDARNRSIASLHAESLAEMIAMTPGNLDHYVNPVSGSLESSGLAAQYLYAWQQSLSADLPKGDGLVCRDGTPDDGHAAEPACDGDDELVVKIFWLDSRHLDGDDGGLMRLTHAVALP
jgi:type IV pilus assembly protein PilV